MSTKVTANNTESNGGHLNFGFFGEHTAHLILPPVG